MNDISLIVDNASIELFADGGLTNMTSIYFPDDPLTNIRIHADHSFKIAKLEVSILKSIWK